MKRNIKRLPIVDIWRHRRDGIDNHTQGYHKNIGKEYKSGDWARAHIDSAYHPNKVFIIEGKSPKRIKDEGKIVYLVSKHTDDIAVLKSISADGKRLKVHVIGENYNRWIDPDNWEVLKVSKGRLDKGSVRENLEHVGEFVESEIGDFNEPKKIEFDKKEKDVASWVAKPSENVLIVNPKFFPKDEKGQKTVLLHEVSEMAYRDKGHSFADSHALATKFTSENYKKVGAKDPDVLISELKKAVPKEYFERNVLALEKAKKKGVI